MQWLIMSYVYKLEIMIFAQQTLIVDGANLHLLVSQEIKNMYHIQFNVQMFGFLERDHALIKLVHENFLKLLLK